MKTVGVYGVQFVEIFIRKSSVIIIVMSIDQSVEENAEYYREELEKIKTEANRVPIIFCINKIDLMDELKVNYLMEWRLFIKNLMVEYGMLNMYNTIFETSAKMESSVMELFHECIERDFKSKIDYLDILKQSITRDLKLVETPNKCLICK